MTPAGEKTLVELLEKHHARLEEATTAHNELVAVVKALQAKIGDIESRGVAYKGVYQKALSYRQGDCVTHSGSIWIAVSATRDAPPSPNWSLAVKGSRCRRGDGGLQR